MARMLQPVAAMTYRNDPTVESDDTDVVERERIVERERPVAAPPASSNVNVSNSGGTYVAAGPGPVGVAGLIRSLTIRR